MKGKDNLPARVYVRGFPSQKNGWNSFFFFFFFFPFPFLSGRGFPTAGCTLQTRTFLSQKTKLTPKSVFRSPPKSKQKTQPKSANPETWTPPTACPKKEKRAVMRLGTNQSIIGWLPELLKLKGPLSAPSAVIGSRKKKIVPKEANPRFFYSHPPRFWWLLAAGRERNEGSSLLRKRTRHANAREETPHTLCTRICTSGTVTVPFCVAYVPDGGSRRQHVFHSPSS